jgi:amino acid transporter
VRAPTPHGLARRTLGAGSLWFFAVSASAPVTVVAGGVVAAFATTGVVGLPLGYLALAGVLITFAVVYTAMSRDVVHPATFYAFFANGLGRRAALAGGAVSLVAYNAIQISLYGLFGATTAAILGGPWWAWAAGVWLLVGLLGILRVRLSARTLAVVVIAQIALLVLLDTSAFLHPAAGTVSVTPLLPDQLFTAGLGGALTLVIASFIGVESVLVYREEAHSHRAVQVAIVGALAVLGVLYALTSWALVVAVGPDNIVALAQDPGAGLPFAPLTEQYGALAGQIGLALLLLSMFAALVSFHNVVARYIYGIAREGVLPGRWAAAASGLRDGVPIAGSIVQSTIAAVVLLFFAAAQLDPVATMFTWLSALAALGVLALMVGACGAALSRYAADPADTTLGQRIIAPVVSGVGLLVTLVVATVNLDSLVGPSPLRWLLPTLLVATAVFAAAWGARLQRRQPGAYAAIGRGQAQPLAVVERAFAGLEL